MVDLLALMALALGPKISRLDRAFERTLRRQGYDSAQRASLREITPGAASRILARGLPVAAFLEQVEYRGRRLAKLGATPSEVIAALREYDSLVEQATEPLDAQMAANFAWVRSQLHFLAVLSLNNAFYQVREAESRTFYELFRVEVESRTLEEMLPRFLEILQVYTMASSSRIYLYDEDARIWKPVPGEGGGIAVSGRLRRKLLKAQSFEISEGTSELVLDPAWAGQYKTCWSVPLEGNGNLRGVMQFAFPKPYDWLPRELEMLMAAGERCWMAAEKARLMDDLAQREEQVRRLAEHMVEVEEAERRRISRELHDEAGQSLLCVRLQMEMLEQELPAAESGIRGRLSALREMTEHTIVEIRRLIAALSPAILEQMGLAAALRQLVGRFRGIHSAEVHIDLPRRLDLPKKVEQIVYRLVQEIFNNIAKYSLASAVNLSLETTDGRLRLRVEDDGVGFDVEEAFSRSNCFGLSGLKERVALLGGMLVVKSRRRQSNEDAGRGSGGNIGLGQIGEDRPGTAIWIELPLDRVTSPGKRPAREAPAAGTRKNRSRSAADAGRGKSPAGRIKTRVASRKERSPLARAAGWS
ncbi:MAG: GAF domain-containing sensor histidine kinase [Bryobacteraceae bacterium]|nr:GAF domain-containing sensor histidine kinase [Bryobacteraceae bacterium]